MTWDLLKVFDIFGAVQVIIYRGLKIPASDVQVSYPYLYS